MNKQLQDALVQFLHLLQAGANFAIQQLPDVLQQWLYYSAVVDIWAIVGYGVGLLAGLGILIFFFGKSVKIQKDYWIVPTIFIGISNIFLVPFCIFNLSQRIQDLIEINLAPKVWLIEHISHLLK